MLQSYMWLLVCVSLWGSNFVFGSILVGEFPPLLLAAFRLLFTSTFLLGYAYFTKRIVKITKKEVKLLLLLGLIGTLCNQSAFFSGLKTIDATTAALILSLTPITTSLLAAIFLKESLTRKMVSGSIVAFIGVFFVLGKNNGFHFSRGVLFIFLAMLTFSISIIIVRKLTEVLDPFITTVYSTLAGCLMLIPVAFFSEPLHELSHQLWAWALLMVTAIVMQGFCALIWNGQLKRVGAGKASIFLNLQPFVAMIVGFFLLGTVVSGSQMFGSLLIIGGVALATFQGQGYRPRKIPTGTA